MNPDFPTLINSNLIKSAGNKLKWIGNLMVLNFIVYVLTVETDILKDTIDFLGLGYDSRKKILDAIFLELKISALISTLLLIFAGRNLVQSTELPKGMKIEMVPPITEVDGNGNTVTKYFFPNGALKKIESYNKENQKNGWWEYYSHTDGKLKYKEFYENGDYKNVYKPD